MKNTPRFRLPRALGVAVLLAAWLTLSNHCALAVLGHGAAAAQGAELYQCCAGKEPAKKNAPRVPAGICCKSLRVLPTDAPVKLVPAHREVLLSELMWTSLNDASAVRPIIKKNATTTGPPRSVTFAERVLQRSLLSHAPPFAA